MSGNVREWVWDGYGAYPKTKTVKDPGYPTNPLKILRGGSWLSTENELRASIACMRVALSLTQWSQITVLLAHDLFAPRQRSNPRQQTNLPH